MALDDREASDENGIHESESAGHERIAIGRCGARRVTDFGQIVGRGQIRHFVSIELGYSAAETSVATSTGFAATF